MLPGDTADTLADGILVQDHALYPLVLACFAACVPGLPAAAGAVLANPAGRLTGQWPSDADRP